VTDRLAAQLAFLAEADRLKSVLRASTLNDASRRENSAEHSWHVMLYAAVLADQAPPGVDVGRVLRMLLIHDLVEIDVGDTPIHAQGAVSHGSSALLAREQDAADRLFGLLPPDQAAAFRALWDEFEAAQTPDAVYAKSIDRVQPVMQNLASGGGTWVDYGVTRDQLESRVGTKVTRALPRVWAHLAPALDRWFAKA
jgi:putative hydrolases of HD superfamily